MLLMLNFVVFDLIPFALIFRLHRQGDDSLGEQRTDTVNTLERAKDRTGTGAYSGAPKGFYFGDSERDESSLGPPLLRSSDQILLQEDILEPNLKNSLQEQTFEDIIEGRDRTYTRKTRLSH